MKKTRITKFTVETERVFIFRNLGNVQPGWCEACGAEAQMTTVADAAREVGLSELAIYKLLDARALHFTEDAERRVSVCLDSLMRFK